MLNVILIICSALLVPGVILRTKSILSGRKGPGIFQPLRDVRVLLLKDSVYSSNAGIIFRIAPSLSLATLIIALLLLPVGNHSSLFNFSGDIVFFTYLLALGRFFMIIAAMETGSSFSGMGANREALYSMLAEPAFLLLSGTFVMITNSTSFTGIFSAFSLSNPYSLILGLTGVYLLIQIAMIENSRLPVDDPKTHLELTMVHEVMILDYCGFDLGLIKIGTWLKFAIFGTLIADCIIPFNIGTIWQILIYLGIQLVFGIVAGTMESFRARNKLMQNPKFILTLTAIGFAAFALMLILTKTKI